MIGESKVKNHKIFVDSEESLENFDPIQHFNTSSELVNRSYNRPRIEQLEETISLNNDIKFDKLKEMLSSKGKSYREVKERTKRSNKLKTAYFELSMEKNVGKKGSKEKLIIHKDGRVTKSSNKKRSNDNDNNNNELEEGDKVIYKWKKQRSK